MSHYTKTKTEMRDPELVAMALEALGYRKEYIVVSKEPLTLRDYRGQDRPEKAHVLIRREHIGNLCNDMGFECGKNPVAHICDYMRKPHQCFNPRIKELGGHGDVFVKKLANEYAAAAVIRQAKQRGKAYERYESAGKIKVFVAA